MPSQEPNAETVRDVQSSDPGQDRRQPSVSDVLASCPAANAVSTPPESADPAAEAEDGPAVEPAADDDTDDTGPSHVRPGAA